MSLIRDEPDRETPSHTNFGKIAETYRKLRHEDLVGQPQKESQYDVGSAVKLQSTSLMVYTKWSNIKHKVVSLLRTQWSVSQM